MGLAEASVKRPVLTSIVFLIVIILGAISYSRLSIDLMPEITYPTISVVTSYGDTGPQEMEELVTRPMEEALAAVQGVEQINSTSAEPERLEKVPLLAKKYNARVIALTMKTEGIPVEADARVNIAVETLIPRMMEIGLPMENLIIDPLVLTVSGCQQYCPHLIEAVRTLQFAWDPPPAISVGLSNVSNAVPREGRPLINRVYCAMLMGVGLQMMIANPFDEKQNDVIRWIETKDTSNPLARAYNKIAERTEAGEEPSFEDFDMSDAEQAGIWKTTQILLNKVIYADSYLMN